MLKLRITFPDNSTGNKELEELLELLKENTGILNESNIYKSRGNTKYNNVYIDLVTQKEDI